MIDDNLVEQFHNEGFAIALALFTQKEVDAYKAHYMDALTEWEAD